MITAIKPAVPQLVLSAIEEIKRKGVEPTAEDIVWLYHAGLKAIGETPQGLPALLDVPLLVGGVLLWPITAGAYHWYHNIGIPLSGSDIRLLAFTLAHSRHPMALKVLQTRAVIADAVNEWLEGVTCSLEALETACDRVTGSEGELVEFESPLENKKRDVTPTNWGWTVALLCHNYEGTTPELWMWESSMELNKEMLIHVSKFIPGNSRSDDDARADRMGEYRAIVLEIIRKGSENVRA